MNHLVCVLTVLSCLVFHSAQGQSIGVCTGAMKGQYVLGKQLNVSPEFGVEFRSKGKRSFNWVHSFNYISGMASGDTIYPPPIRGIFTDGRNAPRPRDDRDFTWRVARQMNLFKLCTGFEQHFRMEHLQAYWGLQLGILGISERTAFGSRFRGYYQYNSTEYLSPLVILRSGVLIQLSDRWRLNTMMMYNMAEHSIHSSFLVGLDYRLNH